MEIVDNENTAIRRETEMEMNYTFLMIDNQRRDVKGEILVQYLLTTPGTNFIKQSLLDSLVIAK